MGTQTDSRLIEQIEPEIAALAAMGRRSWEHVNIKIDLLSSVPLVRDRLAGLDAEAQADPDAELKAISDALEAAIQTLPSRYRTAALDHFGFTDGSPGKGLYQGAREERAVKAFGLGAEWYRKPHRKYFGMKTSEYVIALAACAFCGIANPIAYIVRREGGDAKAVLNEPQTKQDAALDDPLDAPTAPDAFLGELASLGATMVSRESDHLEVFWVGPDNEVFYRWWERGVIGLAIPGDEPAAVSLTAVSREPGDEVLFGLSPDGRVWYRIWELNDRGWHIAGETKWFEDNEIVRGPLSSASRGPDMIELFAFDAGGQPWHRWTEGSMNWSPWTYW